MISFIIIGKNEGWKLTNCIKSVYQAINHNQIKSCEVIYVDSRSRDDSIERAKKFESVRIFNITGGCNAAIARNIGAKESKGSKLFFIDGDMELCPDFINEARELFSNKYRFISGQIEEYYYNISWKFIGKRKIFPSSKLNSFNLTNGGAFAIEKELWESVKGMRTKYNRSQDIDLNYRLVKLGFPIYRSPITFVKHHTIQYNYNPKWKVEISNLKNYLFKGLLIRDHLFNLKIIRRNLRINYTLFFLLLTVFLIGCFKSIIFLLPYLLIVFLRALNQYNRYRKVIRSNFYFIFIKYIYMDIAGIIGIFTFFPSNKKLAYLEIS